MRKVVYNCIKAVLAEKEVSNKELADAMGLTEDAVSAWCVRRYQPSWKNLYSIADYLKVDVREMMLPNEHSPKKDVKF